MKEDIPGPNHYEPSVVCVSRSAPKFTLSGRFVQKGNEKFPGPGDYEQSDRAVAERAPAFTLSGRYQKSAGENANPGPGAYEG